jgi:hypothetical protein
MDVATAASYQADYADHSLSLAEAQVDIDANGKPLYAWHYCITPAFISKYSWKFSRDSLVVIGGYDGAA